jgi:hypothetical protein
MAKTYEVKVTVDYYFDVEAESEKEAEEYASYNFQDYAYSSEIYGIDVEEAINYDEEEEEEED